MQRSGKLADRRFTVDQQQIENLPNFLYRTALPNCFTELLYRTFYVSDGSANFRLPSYALRMHRDTKLLPCPIAFEQLPSVHPCPDRCGGGDRLF